LTLSAGSKVGSFEVIGLLGVGGMGEVYRARDSKLNRDVALKVLPESVTHDSQRVARFRREAQVLASISHPNIGGIHGLEDAGGITALVLELVEGPTLADRIARGPLPVAEALPIAAQILSALEAAHNQGIVHRDLKPANIKLRPDGTVKVLDFGLAKAADPVDQSGDLTNSPTVVSPATQAGILLGTAAYMSPEQARGQIVDKRTDLWAFGCVLFEMLTATPAFGGEHVTDVLASVVRGTPNWSALPVDAQPLLRVLQRCLEKDPRQRLRDAGDVQLALVDAIAAASHTRSQVVPVSKSPWKLLAAGVALGIAVGAVAAILFLPARSASVQTPRRFELKSTAMVPFETTFFGKDVAISPDGARIVYSSTRRGVPELVMQRLDVLEAKTIPGSEGGFDPFFSPDGQQVGFSTFTELKRVGVAGGPSVTICPIDTYYNGASWGENNTIVFAAGALGLFRVPSSGGAAERLFLPDAAKGERGYVRPLVLPGGDSILYTVVLAGGQTRILGRRIGASDSTIVVEGGFGPEYASRRLVFGQADRVMASDFDVATLRVIGSPVAIASGVFNKPANGVANVSMTSDGTAVYVSGHEAPMRNRLVWVDHGGTHLPITGELEYPRFVRLSPDDRRVAVTVGPPAQGQLWVYDLSGATQPTRLTIKDHNLFPTWSPDGKQIAFLSRVGETNHAMVIPSDGSTVQGTPLLKGGGFGVPMAWSPNGEFLLYLKPEKDKVWLLALRDHTERQWLETPFSELGSRFSPDGRWVVFASNQTGASEVWVRPFPGPGAPVRISPDGGQKPLWSKDGKEILYENAGKLWSTRVAIQQSAVRAQPPRVLLEQGFVHDDTDPNMRYVDMARDGRLLVVEPNQAPSDAAIVVAQHWDAELKQR
jgi:serine/threonine protein kinase/Tol biopolymer transport system component